MTTQQLLDEALAARHALLTGKARVVVGFGDRRVEYSAAKLADLDRYIAELRSTLAGKRKARNRITYMVPD